MWQELRCACHAPSQSFAAARRGGSNAQRQRAKRRQGQLPAREAAPTCGHGMRQQHRWAHVTQGPVARSDIAGESPL